MTQTEQNSTVRTRDEQVGAIANDWIAEGMGRDIAYERSDQMILEAEARGAAEQRRKDAEGCEPVAWLIEDKSKGKPDRAHSPDRAVTDKSHADKAARFNNKVSALYTHPANVAALEAEIAELERENTILKKRVINAAETLLSIETPCMEGDNFAVTICSYFEDCEGEPCDNGWHEGATKAYEEIKDAILRHFRAALTREGGV